MRPRVLGSSTQEFQNMHVPRRAWKSTERISISIAEKCLVGSGVLQPRKTQKRCFHQEVQETETGDVEKQQQRQSSRFNKPQTLRGASGAHLGAKQTPEITVSTIFQSREAARQLDTDVQQEDRKRHSSLLQAFAPPAAESGNVKQTPSRRTREKGVRVSTGDTPCGQMKNGTLNDTMVAARIGERQDLKTAGRHGAPPGPGRSACHRCLSSCSLCSLRSVERRHGNGSKNSPSHPGLTLDTDGAFCLRKAIKLEHNITAGARASPRTVTVLQSSRFCCQKSIHTAKDPWRIAPTWDLKLRANAMRSSESGGKKVCQPALSSERSLHLLRFSRCLCLFSLYFLLRLHWPAMPRPSLPARLPFLQLFFRCVCMQLLQPVDVVMACCMI